MKVLNIYIFRCAGLLCSILQCNVLKKQLAPQTAGGLAVVVDNTHTREAAGVCVVASSNNSSCPTESLTSRPGESQSHQYTDEQKFTLSRIQMSTVTSQRTGKASGKVKSTLESQEVLTHFMCSVPFISPLLSHNCRSEGRSWQKDDDDDDDAFCG